MNNKITDIVLASLVADSYSLGAHWIYSPEELQNSNLDWDNLNAPLASWHNPKQKGDFTHYGDQTVCLYEFIKKSNKFDATNYIRSWKIFMDTYSGYKDGSTTETIKNLINNLNIPCGSLSHDLSIIGRISPLLLVSKDEPTFLRNVNEFVSLTHDSEEVLEAADFFAKVLWGVLQGESVMQSITNAKVIYSARLQNYVKSGLTNEKDSIEAINEFGPACSTNGGFQGAIYLLNKYGKDFETALIQNAKAGGDSSARGMIVAMIMVAAYGNDIIPQKWVNQMKYEI